MLQVTVAVDGGPRADLRLCGLEPFAVLLADLASTLGLTEQVRASVSGRPLDQSLGLSHQGVLDGAVICLSPAPEPLPIPRIVADPAIDLAGRVRELAERSAPSAVTRGLVAGWLVLAGIVLGASPALVRAPVWAAAGIPLGVVVSLVWPSLVLALVGPDPARARPAMVAGIWLSGLGMATAAVGAVVVDWPGAALALCGAVVIAVRGRLFADPAPAAAAVAAGLLVAATVAVTAMALHPSWRVWVVGSVVAVGALGLLPLPRLVARRVAEVLESMALMALPPLAVVATGLVELVRR